MFRIIIEFKQHEKKMLDGISEVLLDDKKVSLTDISMTEIANAYSIKLKGEYQNFSALTSSIFSFQSIKINS